jgi:molybdopterin-guanine dinucleotide biosynthesis protein A
MVQATGIILAGGESSRMNYKNKAFLEYKGKTFIEIMVDKITNFDEKIIIGKKNNEFVINGVKNMVDLIPNNGPLYGLYSGLTESSNNISVLIPCDSPFLSSDFLEYMAKLCTQYDCVVPKIGEYYQPLCAAYSKNSISVIKKALDSGVRKVNHIYKDLNIYYILEEEIKKIGDPKIMFKNINTIGEYKKLLAEEN